MSIVRFDPVREAISLREAVDQLFQDSFVRSPLIAQGGFVAPMDVSQDQNDVTVKVSLPGVNPNDVEVSVLGDTLTIKGEIKDEPTPEGVTYLLKERRGGVFNRTLTLPVAVVADKAEAAYKDGVLTLKLPKVEEVKPKKITVSIS